MGDEKKELQFKMDEELLNQVFKDEAKRMEAWEKDPNKKNYKPEEMEIDMGDYYFMTEGSDVDAYRQGNFPKHRNKYRRNYHLKKQNVGND